jgi:hypothetical protein
MQLEVGSSVRRNVPKTSDRSLAHQSSKLPGDGGGLLMPPPAKDRSERS